MTLEVRFLGRVDYPPTFAAMKDFVAQRPSGEREQLWICEHDPVFTLGLAGRPEHVLAPGDIGHIDAQGHLLIDIAGGFHDD